MNLPNLITLARLGLTVGVFVFLELAPRGVMSAMGLVGQVVEPACVWIAFVLFLIAAFTDFLDGYLARRWGMVTPFGRVADPFADKVLTCGTFVILLKFPAATAVLTTWYVVVVLAREFLVTAVRGLVEASGRPFPADRLGKWKMVAQCWTCGALLTMVAGTDTWVWAAQWGFWISLALTVVSGVNYVVKARDVLFAQGAGRTGP